MRTPIREEGLQIDAVLNMGNSLYAILLATVIGTAGVLIKTDELFARSAALYLRFISGGIVLLLVVYYLVDWHDLNLVPYFDKQIGMSQMAKWILCIIIITLASVMSLSGQIDKVALMTGIYMTPVLWFRDKEIGEPDGEMEIRVAYWKGVADTYLSWTRKGLVLLSLISLFFSMIHFCFNWTPNWFYTTIAIITIACWLMALAYKITRSHFLILPKYKDAIKDMAQDQ